MPETSLSAARRRCPWGVAGVALSGVLLAAACQSHDECTAGESHCEGNVIRSCSRLCGHDGCNARWDYANCGKFSCVQPPVGAALCAAHTDPEPACSVGRKSLCNGSRLIQCDRGYATVDVDCAEFGMACVDVSYDSADCSTPSYMPEHDGGRLDASASRD